MRTARSSSRPGGSPPGSPPDQAARDQAPPPRPGTPPWTIHPPPRGQTCKHITLPQTSFAGGNYAENMWM